MKFKFGGVLIWKNGKVLLVQEKHKAARGLWSLPLGFVEKNETLREGTVREAKEETGYAVQLKKKMRSIFVKARDFHSAHPFLRGRVHLTVFYAETVGKRSRKTELKTGWFSRREIEALNLRGDWEKKILLPKQRVSDKVR